MFDPTTPKLLRVRAAISTESWLERVAQARAAEEVLRKVADAGLSLNAALAKHLPANRRSWALRWLRRYQSLGLEGLIDQRVSREPTVSRACRRIVEAARTADPRVTVEQIWALLREARLPPPLPSEATIKREFARVDEQRRAQNPPPDVVEEVLDLPFAGGELLTAAEQETGGIAALTQEVGQIAEWAQSASVGQTPAKDTERRDERGHFTADYNRARTRQPGEPIASYLRTAEEKAEGRVPSWPRFVREPPRTL